MQNEYKVRSGAANSGAPEARQGTCANEGRTVRCAVEIMCPLKGGDGH